MTEAEWLASTDPVALLRACPATDEQLAAIIARLPEGDIYSGFMRNGRVPLFRVALEECFPGQWKSEAAANAVRSVVPYRRTYSHSLTEAEWLTCDDPQAMMRVRPATPEQLELILDHAMGSTEEDDGFWQMGQRNVLRNMLSMPSPGMAWANPKLASVIRCLIPYRPVKRGRRWLTPTVRAIAKGVEADGAFDRLPVLADALEDAGVDDAGLLAHCRGGGPHVKGCWVVDWCLSKGRN